MLFFFSMLHNHAVTVRKLRAAPNKHSLVHSSWKDYFQFLSVKPSRHLNCYLTKLTVTLAVLLLLRWWGLSCKQTTAFLFHCAELAQVILLTRCVCVRVCVCVSGVFTGVPVSSRVSAKIQQLVNTLKQPRRPPLREFFVDDFDELLEG